MNLTNKQVPRITLLSFDYPPLGGGISRLCASLVATFTRTPHAVIEVITQHQARAIPASPKNSQVKERRVTFRRPWREWQALRAIRARPEGSAVICGLWYPEGLIAVLARARPVIILAHGAELLPTPARWRRGAWKNLMTFVLRRADLVIANSRYTERLLRSEVPGCRTCMVPLAVDADHFSPGNRESAKAKFGVEGKTIISTVSRVHKYKGHETVLKAIAALSSDERRDLIYVVAGEGPDLGYFQEIAHRLEIAENVRWLGTVSEEKLPDLYRASDLFAVCSEEHRNERQVEGFGLVFLEAQACGTPVVGADAGGIPDAVREGQGGFLVPPGDWEKLSRILSLLLKDPVSFAAEGRKARERVLRECTWEHYLASLENELRERHLSPWN